MLDFDHKSENIGELKRPVVSEESAVFKKAASIINMRRLIAKEIERMSEDGVEE